MQRLAILLLLAPWLLPAAGAAGQPLARARVVDAAAVALIAGHGGGIEAQPLDADDDALLMPPPGALALRARVMPGSVLSRRMVVQVDISVGDHHWRTLPVWFAVRAWRPVWVAREALAAGQPASAEHFELQRREVATLPAPPLPASHALGDWRLRRALAPGEVLTQALVDLQPAVARQQPVQVRVRAGGVELQAAGVALADARIGDRVRVMNPASNESFAARVVARGLVVADER